MSKLVLLTGPQAVGKMTVGQELAKITDLKLFHNHMTIDLVSNFFSYSKKEGGEVYYIELQAPLDVRLERNKTENRKKHKASKRDIAFSEKLLLRAEGKHRMESMEGEVKEKNYLKIDNTNISAKEVAKIIKEKFNL